MCACSSMIFEDHEENCFVFTWKLFPMFNAAVEFRDRNPFFWEVVNNLADNIISSDINEWNDDYASLNDAFDVHSVDSYLQRNSDSVLFAFCCLFWSLIWRSHNRWRWTT